MLELLTHAALLFYIGHLLVQQSVATTTAGATLPPSNYYVIAPQ
jgi:hypothetical protein